MQDEGGSGQYGKRYVQITPHIVDEMYSKLKEHPDACFLEHRVAPMLPFYEGVHPRLDLRRSFYDVSIFSYGGSPESFGLDDKNTLKYGLEPLVTASIINQIDARSIVDCFEGKSDGFQKKFTIGDNNYVLKVIREEYFWGNKGLVVQNITKG